MYKKISMALFLLLIAFQSIYTKVITTYSLEVALREVEPGDIIELKSGTYRVIQYQFKNGTKKERITIRPAPNAEVYFEGPTSSYDCVFEATGLQYVTFEGPINIVGANCGFKFLKSYSVNITEIRFFDIKGQAIVISGTDNVLYKNQIYGCVTDNRYTAKTRTSGWSKCVSVSGGCCHTIKNNTISFSFGESLYLANVSSTVVAHNEITNGLNANIYINSSKHIDIDGNILRVNSTEYDNKYGAACGIAMTNVNNYVVRSINITNNIIIGTRIGIHYFMQDVKGGYEFISISHNTLWNVHVTPIWFENPEKDHSYGVGSELKNNFIYFEGAKELEPKKFWKIGYNLYYNTNEVPSIYSDTTSQAAKDLPLNTVFNKINGCSDYFNQDLKPECLRPSKEPGKLQLFQSGTAALKEKVLEDIAYCRRNSDSPSIGAFEFTEGCSGGLLPPTDTPITDAPITDAPIRDYDVRFNITYCTEEYHLMRIVGSFCNFHVASAEPMIQDKKCHWTYTFKDGTTKEFRYKFVDSVEGSAYKVENDPFRMFKGKELAKLVSKNIVGKYEDCDYSISGDIVTLVCTWR